MIAGCRTRYAGHAVMHICKLRPGSNALTAKIVNERSKGACAQLKGRQSNGQVEAPRPGASGIEIEHPVNDPDSRPMRVAGNHYGNPAQHGIQPQFLDIVQHVNGAPAEFYRLGVRIFFCPLVSTFPLIAVTGAIRRSPAITSGFPISPPWMICATPASRCSACGRRRPWVSEMIPIVSTAAASSCGPTERYL
jgi:hypothetical protein